MEVLAMDRIYTFPVIPRKRISGLGIGEYPGQHRGQGHDFIEKRPYQPSDSTRNIDWKETAKRSAQRSIFSPHVRQFRQDEIMRAVIVVDRSPRMSWYPSPWLSKPQVIVAAGCMIIDSIKRHHGLIGYLDYANWTENSKPFWRSPNQETESDRVRNRNLLYKKFAAPENNMSLAIEWLFALKAHIPPESFIFLLSDFLVMPDYSLLEVAAERWDLVPIVIQDPVLEASFPVWRGKIPVWLPEVLPNGQRKASYLSALDAQAIRIEHQNRLRAIMKVFDYIKVHPITLFSADPEQVYDAFLGWSMLRIGGT